MVKITDIVEEMESASDEIRSYYNIKTGEIVTKFDFYEDPDLDDELEDNFDDYIGLPDQYDIDEYNIMEEFIETIEDSKMYNQLESSIIGKGAFRRFKDTVNELRIANVWYDFREEAYKKIAIEWCNDNNIEYDD